MDKVNRTAAIVVWIVSIMLWVLYGFWYLAAGLFALHFVEIFIKGIPVGTASGKSKIHSIIMTLIFGFTWWLPLQREME